VQSGNQQYQAVRKIDKCTMADFFLQNQAMKHGTLYLLAVILTLNLTVS
jgi:hypothetical protein